MRARQGLLDSELFGDDLKKLLPVIREGGSDTATFDNVLELLVRAGRSLPHAILMMIPGAVERERGDGARPQGVLRVPRLVDGAVGRAGVDCVHRRHGDRRRARPQRAAPVAVLRDQGRPGHHGVGSRRARRSARERPRQGAAAAGPHLPRRHRQGPHRRRRGDQAGAGGGASLSGVARRAPDRHRRSAPGARRRTRPRDGAEAAAGVRLHAGGPARPHRPDGHDGRGAGRLDGHRHVAGGALGAPARALRLLQAALRAGDQSAARRHPRGAGDVDGLDDRPRAQPAEAGARVVPADHDQVPDHPQRARREAAPPAAGFAVPLDDAGDAVRSGEGRHRRSSRRWTNCAGRRAKPWPPATTS